MSQNLSKLASISDLRDAARQRLPRFAFDFLDGGAESEAGLRSNERELSDIRLVPRYCRDVSKISTEVELFGKTYDVPFGAAPVGLQNTAWPRTDIALAKLAAEKSMPFGVSTSSSTPLELMAEAAEGFGWFQLYMSEDTAITDALLSRAEAAGFDVLVITVDVCQPGKRDRDIRNGLQFPMKITPRIALDLALHPQWSLGTWRAGLPKLANLQGIEAEALPLEELQRRFLTGRINWDDLTKLRDRWKGKLAVKGILHPEDAQKAVKCGCDGVVVSNHGGRQADYAISSIAALPAITKEVGDKTTILFDSGIRRGADIVRAKAQGAQAVLTGRPFVYGAAAGGAVGIARAYEILETELRFTLGQIGTPDFNKVGTDILATL